MAKRTQHNQTCHNSSVARRAAGLMANDWKVKDGISGGGLTTTPEQMWLYMNSKIWDIKWLLEM